MSEPKTLARPYAVAAYYFAKERNQVAAWETMLANIRTLVLTEQMQQIVNSPASDAASLLKMLHAFSEKCLDVSGLNFLICRTSEPVFIRSSMRRIFSVFQGSSCES